MPDTLPTTELQQHAHEIGIGEIWKTELSIKGKDVVLIEPKPVNRLLGMPDYRGLPIGILKATSITTGKVIDFIEFTPSEWSHILLLPGDYRMPQIRENLKHTIEFREDERQMLWGRGLVENGYDFRGKDLTPRWIMNSVLWARFLEEFGTPVDPHAAKAVFDYVPQKSLEILSAVNDPNNTASVKDLFKNVFSDAYNPQSITQR